MRDEYTGIYGKLSNDYLESFTSRYTDFEKKQYSAAKFVERAVAGAIGNLNLKSRIRSDAHHFLVVNFHQMIVMPLLMSPNAPYRIEYNSNEKPFYSDEFYKVISDDIMKILSSAADNEGQGEISGHAILDAVSTQYRKLRTTQFQIWG